eukprot:2712686-Rhodomonas_salina.1
MWHGSVTDAREEIGRGTWQRRRQRRGGRKRVQKLLVARFPRPDEVQPGSTKHGVRTGHDVAGTEEDGNGSQCQGRTCCLRCESKRAVAGKQGDRKRNLEALKKESMKSGSSCVRYDSCQCQTSLRD